MSPVLIVPFVTASLLFATTYSFNLPVAVGVISVLPLNETYFCPSIAPVAVSPSPKILSTKADVRPLTVPGVTALTAEPKISVLLSGVQT